MVYMFTTHPAVYIAKTKYIFRLNVLKVHSAHQINILSSLKYQDGKRFSLLISLLAGSQGLRNLTHTALSQKRDLYQVECNEIVTPKLILQFVSSILQLACYFTC